MATPDEIARYRGYVQGETDGVFYYRTLATLADTEPLRELYAHMADMEQRHLGVWQEQLRQAGQPVPTLRPTRRARSLMWLARRFGPDVVLPVLKSMETGADATYAAEPVAAAAGLPADERSHARIFSAMGGANGNSRGLAGPLIARIETRHRTLGGGNALRAAVLGANDGLVSNLALVMGVAGANPGRATVLLAGVAGLLAGAFSMALGEWISVTSAREAAEAQLAAEAEEIRMFPDDERDELALIYQAKGLPQADAQALAAQIMANPDTALSTLAREELGIVPEDLGSAWTAATASFLLFAIGAILPVVPFFVWTGVGAIVVSSLVSALALFVVGGSITLLTGRSPWYSGARQVVLGLVAAVITYGVGSLVGGVTGL